MIRENDAGEVGCCCFNLLLCSIQKEILRAYVGFLTAKVGR